MKSLFNSTLFSIIFFITSCSYAMREDSNPQATQAPSPEEISIAQLKETAHRTGHPFDLIQLTIALAQQKHPETCAYFQATQYRIQMDLACFTNTHCNQGGNDTCPIFFPMPIGDNPLYSLFIIKQYVNAHLTMRDLLKKARDLMGELPAKYPVALHYNASCIKGLELLKKMPHNTSPEWLISELETQEIEPFLIDYALSDIKEMYAAQSRGEPLNDKWDRIQTLYTSIHNLFGIKPPVLRPTKEWDEVREQKLEERLSEWAEDLKQDDRLRAIIQE